MNYLPCYSKPLTPESYVALVKPTDGELLHRQMGHLNIKDVRKLNTGCYLPKNFHCDTCSLAKSKRKSVPNKAAPRSTAPGQITHMDIMGKINIRPFKGNHAFDLVLVDDATRYTTVYMLNRKSDALSCFKQYIDDMKFLQINIGANCILQSDSDSVFKANDFKSYCNQLGIKQRFSAPYTQAQNGVVERWIYSLSDTARAMLIGANLPFRLWDKAIKHACFVRNRCPTSALKGKSPYEALFKIKPDLFPRCTCLERKFLYTKIMRFDPNLMRRFPKVFISLTVLLRREQLS